MKYLIFTTMLLVWANAFALTCNEAQEAKLVAVLQDENADPADRDNALVVLDACEQRALVETLQGRQAPEGGSENQVEKPGFCSQGQEARLVAVLRNTKAEPKARNRALAILDACEKAALVRTYNHSTRQ